MAQTFTQTSNRDLGTDEELSDLVGRIRCFNYAAATPKENLALTKALKIMAEDILQRREKIIEMQAELQSKLSLAEVTSELSEVISTLREDKPTKRTWSWGIRQKAW